MERVEASQARGWEKHRDEQMRSWLSLTFEQRLDWLESAKEFAAEALGAAYSASSQSAKLTGKRPR